MVCPRNAQRAESGANRDSSTLNRLEEVFGAMETSTRALLENWPETEIKIDRRRRLVT
jgi:hypothetical protein